MPESTNLAPKAVRPVIEGFKFLPLISKERKIAQNKTQGRQNILRFLSQVTNMSRAG